MSPEWSQEKLPKELMRMPKVARSNYKPYVLPYAWVYFQGWSRFFRSGACLIAIFSVSKIFNSAKKGGIRPKSWLRCSQRTQNFFSPFFCDAPKRESVQGLKFGDLKNYAKTMKIVEITVCFIIARERTKQPSFRKWGMARTFYTKLV